MLQTSTLELVVWPCFSVPGKEEVLLRREWFMSAQSRPWKQMREVTSQTSLFLSINYKTQPWLRQIQTSLWQTYRDSGPSCPACLGEGNAADFLRKPGVCPYVFLWLCISHLQVVSESIYQFLWFCVASFNIMWQRTMVWKMSGFSSSWNLLSFFTLGLFSPCPQRLLL